MQINLEGTDAEIVFKTLQETELALKMGLDEMERFEAMSQVALKFANEMFEMQPDMPNLKEQVEKTKQDVVEMIALKPQLIADIDNIKRILDTVQPDRTPLTLKDVQQSVNPTVELQA